MSPKAYNLAFPFDETYAWENFIIVVQNLKQAERVVFYGFNRKLTFYKIGTGPFGKVLITSQSLSEPEEQELNNQNRFEKVFMSAILKDANKHLHTYEKSATRNPDWRKQRFRCIDPDCRHYDAAAFIVGKRAKCHKCGEPIIVEKEQIRNAAIVGLCCSKSKKAKVVKTAASVLDDLFTEQHFKEISEAQTESHEGMLKLVEDEE